MMKLRHPALIVPAIQCVIGCAGALIGLWIHSPAAAFSALAGGLVAAGPQSVFGWWAFKARGARRARVIAQNLFVGEGLKLSLTAILFAVLWMHADELVSEAVLASFIVAILAGQLSLPLMMRGRSTY